MKPPPVATFTLVLAKHSGNSRNNLLAIYFVALADQINLHLLAWTLKILLVMATATRTREYLANGPQFAIFFSRGSGWKSEGLYIWPHYVIGLKVEIQLSVGLGKIF